MLIYTMQTLKKEPSRTSGQVPHTSQTKKNRELLRFAVLSVLCLGCGYFSITPRTKLLIAVRPLLKLAELYCKFELPPPLMS